MKICSFLILTTINIKKRTFGERKGEKHLIHHSDGYKYDNYEEGENHLIHHSDKDKYTTITKKEETPDPSQ
jgi:hypothetical protein